VTIVSRYITREFLKLFGLVLLSFLSIYLIVDFFERIRMFLSNQASICQMVSYFLYTLPMIAAAVAPWVLGLTGWVYGAASIALNAVFLLLAVAVLANKATEPQQMGPEKKLFAFSILYLFGLFPALVVDRWAI
jgi:heme O synthase-like polyprenyltransferase